MVTIYHLAINRNKTWSVCIQLLGKTTLPESSQAIKCCFVHGRGHACLHTGYTGMSCPMHVHLTRAFSHIQPTTLAFQPTNRAKGFLPSQRPLGFPSAFHFSLPLSPIPFSPLSVEPAALGYSWRLGPSPNPRILVLTL